jgi:hypothetical protein
MRTSQYVTNGNAMQRSGEFRSAVVQYNTALFLSIFRGDTSLDATAIRNIRRAKEQCRRLMRGA